MGWTRALRTGPKPRWKSRNRSPGNEEINSINPACRNNITVLSCSLLLRTTSGIEEKGSGSFFENWKASMPTQIAGGHSGGNGGSRLDSLLENAFTVLLVPLLEENTAAQDANMPWDESLKGDLLTHWDVGWYQLTLPKGGFTWTSPKKRDWEGTEGQRSPQHGWIPLYLDKGCWFAGLQKYLPLTYLSRSKGAAAA